MRFTCTAITRHTRLIIDKRELPTDQTVEQCRFADIRSADQRDRKRHFSSPFDDAPLRGFAARFHEGQIHFNALLQTGRRRRIRHHLIKKLARTFKIARLHGGKAN